MNKIYKENSVGKKKGDRCFFVLKENCVFVLKTELGAMSLYTITRGFKAALRRKGLYKHTVREITASL